MEKEDAIALIRSLLSSTSSACNIPRLLREFKEETGQDLGFYGYRTASEFLRSIPDTVRIVGQYPNEEVCLVKSEKSAHVVDLVDNQKVNTKRKRRGGRPRPPLRTPLRRDNFSRSNGPPRRDLPPRRDPPPRRPRLETSYRSDPPRNSYSNSRTFESSKPFRPQTPENLPVYVCPEDQEKLYNFLEERPGGVTFNEVTNFMLGRNENWSKYHIKNGVPELIEYCSNFSIIHADKVYSLNSYRQLMKNYKVDVGDNGYEPAGNESSYSEDGFFDDEYDDDEYYYEEEESAPSSKSNEHSIPESVKQKKPLPCDTNTLKARLKEIMKKYPNGVWCTDLLHVYEKFYNEELKFQSYGYSCLIHMLLEMPDVVNCKQPGDGDWRIYEASSQSNDVSDVLQQVKQNILSVLNSKNEITEAEVAPMYYKMFKERLNYDDFGFDSLRDFLKAFEEELFYRKRKDNKEILVPKFQMILVSNYGSKSSRSNASVSRGSSDNEIYPEEVVGPNEKLPEMDLRQFAKIGEYIEVFLGEIWHPHKFFIQLRRFKTDLFALMDKLQAWYNKFVDVLKMPDEAIVPDQVCVALYDLTPTSAEWHRAVIKKKLEDGLILVCLVDYGTITKLKKDRLRFLHKEFASLPIQGLMSRLANISPKNSTTWSREASRRFLDLVFDKDLVAGVVDVDFKKSFLSLALSYTQTKKEIHIADTLEEEGYATFVVDVINKPVHEQSSRPSGPNRAMKPVQQAKVEAEEIFEINEPDNIVEIIKTQIKAPEKSKKASEPLLALETKPKLNPLSIPKPHVSPLPSPLAPLASNTLGTNPAASANPLLANPTLATTLLNQTSCTKLATDNTLLLNTLQQNLMTQTAAPQPTTNLLEQMANLSLLGSVQVPQTPTRAPPGFGPPMSEQDFKEKVNTEALKLLVSQPHINAIAKTNLDLAMQLATKIAKDQLEKERQKSSQPPPLLNYLNANFYLQNLNFQNMNSTLQNPLAGVQNPLANVQNPLANVQSLLGSIQNPLANVQNPLANVQNPLANAQNPLTSYQNLSATLQNQTSNIPNPIPNIQNPIQNIQSAVPNLQSLNLNLQNPKASMDSPLSPVANTQNPNTAVVHPQAISPPRKSSSGPRRKIQIQIEDDDFKTPSALPDIVKNTKKEAPSSVCLVYKMELKNKPIHIISLDDQLFVLAEEVIKHYTPFSDKNIVDKILNSKKISFNYVAVSRKEPIIFREIERWHIERVPNQEDEFTLLPLNSLMKYLKSMVRIDDGTTLAIYEFVENCEAEIKQVIS